VLVRVGGRVEGDGRGGVRVGDGDPHPLARVRPGAVRGPQLLAGVALDRVRDLPAVRVRQRGRDVRAVVRGERPGVLEHGAGRGQLVRVVRLVRRVVQAGDGQDGTIEAVRRRGRLRGRPVGLGALGVVVQLGAEGLLGGGHVTGDGDVVLRDTRDLQARGRQPGLHRGDLRLGRAEAGLRLPRAQVRAVRGRVRVRHGLRVRGQAGGVPACEVDPGGDLGGVRSGALVGLGGRPGGLGAGQRVPARVVRGVRRGYAERQRAGDHGQCRRHAHPGAHLGTFGSHRTPCAVRREWITRRWPLSR
jgi:hypothetical protein